MAGYDTLQAILEEAGLQHVVLAEEPYGAVNGSNKVFVTHQKPLADANYSDSITPADVTVYVNDTPVKVVGVDEQTGAITLQTAPPDGATIAIDYRYAAFSLQAANAVREEAQDWIDGVMGDTDTVPYDPVPPTIRKVCRVYAAGMLATREFGYNADDDNTSKDGDMKIKRAERWLADYLAKGGNSSASSTTQIEDIEVTSSGDMFRHDRPHHHHHHDDDEDCEE